MKNDRKLFNFWEKVVIFTLSLVAIFLIVQVVSLYNAEVSTTANPSVKHEQVDKNIDSVEAKSTEKKQKQEPEKKAAVVKNDRKQENKENKNKNTKNNKNNQNNHEKQKLHAKTVKAKQEPNHSPKQKVAYLTIDDGPTEVEHELLDLLASYHAKATFFMLEPYMKKYPDAVKRIVDEGHVPALHGVTHNAKKFYRSKETVLQEMNKAQKTLEQITGYRATLIRTPYGSSPRMTPEYKQAVKEHGYRLWDWNVDSRDWKYTDGSFVEYSIQQIEKLAEKGEDPIILLHSKRSTVEHLPRLLDYLVEQGYSFEVLDASLEPYQLP